MVMGRVRELAGLDFHPSDEKFLWRSSRRGGECTRPPPPSPPPDPPLAGARPAAGAVRNEKHVRNLGLHLAVGGRPELHWLHPSRRLEVEGAVAWRGVVRASS